MKSDTTARHYGYESIRSMVFYGDWGRQQCPGHVKIRRQKQFFSLNLFNRLPGKVRNEEYDRAS
jgi:hypothetical protein